MDSREAARAFNRQFMAVYGRFYRRTRPQAYAPSPETLAVLQHLENTGPLTVTEAARHFSRSQAALSEARNVLSEELLAHALEQMSEEGSTALLSAMARLLDTKTRKRGLCDE